MKNFYAFNNVAKFVFLLMALFMVMWNIFAFFLVETEKQFDTGMFVMVALFLLGWLCDEFSAPAKELRDKRSRFLDGF